MNIIFGAFESVHDDGTPGTFILLLDESDDNNNFCATKLPEHLVKTDCVDTFFTIKPKKQVVDELVSLGYFEYVDILV